MRTSRRTGVSTFASRTSQPTSQSLQKSVHFQPHRQSITADIQITTERTPATNTALAKVPVQCSALTFVVKIANFAKPKTVMRHALEETTHLKQPN